MASSQVEIASNAPFGCVLKERNRHDHHHRCRTRESNAFQKNFQDLVQNHLSSCISGHSRKNSSSGLSDLWVHDPHPVNNENGFHSLNSGDATMSDPNENHIDYADLWVHNPNNDMNTKKTKGGGDKWDKARDIVFASDRNIQESAAISSSSGLVKNQGNASSGIVKNQESSSSGPVKNQGSSSSGIVKNQESSSSGPVKNQANSSSSSGIVKNPESSSSGTVKSQGNSSSGTVKNPESSSSGPLKNHQGCSSSGPVKNQESSSSGPFKNHQGSSSSGPVKNQESSSSGPVKNQNQGDSSSGLVKNQGNSPSRLVKNPESSSGLVKNQGNASSTGPVSSSQRAKIPQHPSSSIPVPTPPQRGGAKEGAPSEAVLTTSNSKRERSPDRSSTASVPISTPSRRASNWEVVSSRLLPSSSSQKSSQEGIMPGHNFRSKSLRESSPARSECSLELPSSLGVSSLVRKWRDFEAESKSLGAATNSSVCTSSRCNSLICCAENDPFADGHGRSSDAGEELVDIRPSTPTKSEDLFFDWESDQTGLSGPPSIRGRDSDATEKEKIRVADIIKKLTSSNGECQHHSDVVSHESLPRVRTSLDKPELRPFSSAAAISPRIIRTRQAYSDLLVQMERDNQKELEGLADSKAVSKFSYRGRIQNMLRVRFLRRGAEEKDGRRANSTSSETSRVAQSAIISHIRQRFSEGVQHKDTDSRIQHGEEVVDKAAPQGKKVAKENHQQEHTENRKPLNNVLEDNNLDAQKGIRNEVLNLSHQDSPTVATQQNDHQQHQSEISHEENNATSDVVMQQQETKSEFCSNHEKLEFTLKETSGTEHLENQNLIGISSSSNHEFLNVTAETQVTDMEDEEVHQNLVVSDYIQETNVSQQFGEWEGLQDEQELESHQDWICDVSRPRSTWEDLRQARYQEMLDPYMENNDIRELLKRGSVSSFLSSSLKDNIDRLMMSRSQQSPRPMIRVRKEEITDQLEGGDEAQKVGMKAEEEEEEEEKDCLESQEEEKQLNRSIGYEQDKEDEIQSEQECIESHYAAQLTTWENNEDGYFVPPSYSSSASPDTHPSPSFTNPPSIEMQFMYEMRGNMEQLHQEISKLRRSIKSCVSMQMKLQKFIALEAISSSSHSGGGGRKKRKDAPVHKKSSRARCCVCYEMQVDSLLYRCGHMCTCFKCAQDLQWSSGKCPICEAPIKDVVRAYSCS